MILSASSGLRGVLVNAETGARIPFARWANLDTGDYQAWQATPDGQAIAQPPVLLRGKCRLRFVESYAPAVRPSLPDGTGSEAEARALREQFRRVTERIMVVRGIGCEHPGCGRDAEWLVGDLLYLPPAEDGARLCARQALVNRHRYCSRHYRLPRVLGPNGDTVREVEVTAMPER